MLRFLLRRLLLTVPVLLGLTVLVAEQGEEALAFGGGRGASEDQLESVVDDLHRGFGFGGDAAG